MTKERPGTSRESENCASGDPFKDFFIIMNREGAQKEVEQHMRPGGALSAMFETQDIDLMARKISTWFYMMDPEETERMLMSSDVSSNPNSSSASAPHDEPPRRKRGKLLRLKRRLVENLEPRFPDQSKSNLARLAFDIITVTICRCCIDFEKIPDGIRQELTPLREEIATTRGKTTEARESSQLKEGLASVRDKRINKPDSYYT